MSDQPYGEDPLRKRPDDGTQGQQPPQDPYGQPPAYGQQTPGQDPYGQDPYGQQPYGAAPDSGNLKTQSIVAIVLSVLLLCCCWPGALVSGVLAILGLTKVTSDLDGARKFVRYAWIAAAVSLVLGIIVNFALFSIGFYDSYTSDF